MITGAHVMLQSSKEEADKAFFRDVLQLPNVDAGNGFLIFAVPSAEVAVHEGRGGGHELSLMCDNIEAFVEEMRSRDIYCSPAQNRGWGIMTQVTLPGGGRLGVYQPLHQRPKQDSGDATRAKSGAGAAKAKAGSKRKAAKPQDAMPRAGRPKAKAGTKRKAATPPRAKLRGR